MLFLCLLCLITFETRAWSVSERLNQPEEPRIFFKEIAEASGIFPIEINVPDTIMSMFSGMSQFYEYMSSFFSGEGQGGGMDEEDQQSQVSYDEVDFNSKPIITPPTVAGAKKKLKKMSQYQEDEDYSIFDLFRFLLF